MAKDLVEKYKGLIERIEILKTKKNVAEKLMKKLRAKNLSAKKFQEGIMKMKAELVP